ncbi:MAG TPA: hypothetical protein VN625_09040, partial [Desulfuromonadaceae bacterium]|nr:hypothetical protein [Desulfuromonadaceae bacterium]
MRNWLKIILFLTCGGAIAARAGNLDTIGMTLLRATTTNLNGGGIRVGQPEAPENPNAWEVSPAAEQQPTNLFTYYFSSAPYTTITTANTYTNSLGTESHHGDVVGSYFYGITNGIATNVAHVDNYDANSYINYYIANSRAISNRIVNQSFAFNGYDPSTDQFFDNFAAQYNVLLLSGINGLPIDSPATCYNGIAVGTTNIVSVGPTSDGRCKPDLLAPDVLESSFGTAQVSGAATILLQAALRGDGGGDTNSAGDMRTLKALLLNGAVKPAGWSNTLSQPLDLRYGAGMLNVFNSYRQLAGG